jgi:hypothetical protein
MGLKQANKADLQSLMLSRLTRDNFSGHCIGLLAVIDDLFAINQ